MDNMECIWSPHEQDMLRIKNPIKTQAIASLARPWLAGVPFFFCPDHQRHQLCLFLPSNSRTPPFAKIEFCACSLFTTGALVPVHLTPRTANSLVLGYASLLHGATRALLHETTSEPWAHCNRYQSSEPQIN